MPVVPLTIKQYCHLIENIYDKNINILDFIKLLFEIHNIALQSENFNVWNEKANKKITEWINCY